MTLSELKKGQSAQIDELCVCGALRKRLLDMGFVKGSRLQCLSESPLGDPRAYAIKGAVVALRKREADRINVAFCE